MLLHFSYRRALYIDAGIPMSPPVLYCVIICLLLDWAMTSSQWPECAVPRSATGWRHCLWQTCGRSHRLWGQGSRLWQWRTARCPGRLYSTRPGAERKRMRKRGRKRTQTKRVRTTFKSIIILNDGEILNLKYFKSHGSLHGNLCTPEDPLLLCLPQLGPTDLNNPK